VLFVIAELLSMFEWSEPAGGLGEGGVGGVGGVGEGRTFVRSVSHLAGDGSPRQGSQISGVELPGASLVGLPGTQDLPASGKQGFPPQCELLKYWSRANSFATTSGFSAATLCFSAMSFTTSNRSNCPAMYLVVGFQVEKATRQ
jgi:hypothetical protein